MPRARVTRAGLAALTLLALASAVALAGDPGNVIYQWTDEHGNVRYTPDPDRIPIGQRATQVRLEPGMPATNVPARPPATPLAPAKAASATAPPSAAPSVVVPPIERPTPAPAPVAQPSAVAAPIATTPPVAPLAPPEPTPAPLVAPSPTPAPPALSSAPPAPLAAPSSDTSPAPPPAPLPPADAAAREQQLAAAIAADQEALKGMLAATPTPGEEALGDSPQLREIAHRLPELQAELAALRERQKPPAGP